VSVHECVRERERGREREHLCICMYVFSHARTDIHSHKHTYTHTQDLMKQAEHEIQGKRVEVKKAFPKGSLQVNIYTYIYNTSKA
jgi:hypothetical protein